MNEKTQALIAYRLECSDEMLSDARALTEEGRWKLAVCITLFSSRFRP